MNPELQRQHEAHKARQARMGRPVQRAIVADVVRGPLLLERDKQREAEREARLLELDRQHKIRLACIAEAFEGERLMSRSLLSTLLSDALIDITRREAEALRGERQFYLMELDAEARK